MPSLRETSQKSVTESANDNEAFGFAAGEGVVHCLHFLATEAENLGYTASAEICLAAFALQAEIEAGRQSHTKAGIPAAGNKVRPPADMTGANVTAWAPGA